MLHASTQQQTSRPGRVWHALGLIAMVLLATIPVADKAFHIDDVYYLQVARHILADPWRPYDFHWVAEGRICYAFDNDWSPPLFKYLLALGVLGFRESELPLHGLMVLMTACVALSVYSLGRRFSPRPLLAPLLVVLNPLFVPGQNLMLDVPMLALSLAGMACHVWGTDRNSLRLIMAGGLLCGLAVVTKYPAMMVYPLLSLYSLVRKSWLGIPALAMAVAPLACWCAHNMLVHGKLHFLYPMFGGPDISWSRYGMRLVSVLTIVGSGMFPLMLVGRTVLPRYLQYSLVCVSLVLAGCWAYFKPAAYWHLTVQQVLFLAGGLFLLMAASCMRIWVGSTAAQCAAGDYWFLFGWLALGWFMPLGSQFIAVRHVIGVLPPAALLASMFVSPVDASTGRIRTALFPLLVALIGFSVGWADRELANIQRQQVLDVAVSLAGSETYYLGEDTLAYYGVACGWKPLLVEYVPTESDVFLVCASATSWALPPALKNRLVRVFEGRDESRFPVSTMAYGVNYYRTGIRDLPWAVGRPAELYLDIYFMPRAQDSSP